MVFVRKVKTASGATAVQIAERVGGRDKVLEHLGSAHDDAELTALLASARDRLRPGQGELDLSAGRVPAGHAVITGKRHVVVWQVLTGAYARLGFDAIGDAAFAQLVLARIIEPTSKLDSARVLEEVGVSPASGCTRWLPGQDRRGVFRSRGHQRGHQLVPIRRDHVVLRGRERRRAA